MKRNSILIPFSIIVICVLTFSNCTYNNEEELYPPIVIEPAGISYTMDILPILEVNCYTCHSSISICAGVNLEGYTNVVARIENGSLLGVIRHEEGWEPMPQGSSKLSDSLIGKISDWIEQGYPNN